jgi:hypothetical protein
MLLALFLVILAISLGLIWFGEYTEEGVYSLGGLLFLFLLGLSILLPGNLQIPNGETVNYSYACGCCDGHQFILNDSSGFFCFGFPNGCDHYDLNLPECLAHNCTYDFNTTFCYGTPYPCSNYSNPVSCYEAGCEYEYQPEPTCPNGTEKVITTETHTPIQTNFSDTFSHIMGVWLTLIAVFGFAIKLGQIREGFKDKNG